MSQKVTLSMALLFFMAHRAHAQDRIVPTAPVANFRLPLFSDEGRLTTLIKGSEATAVNSREAQVKEVTIALFSEKDAKRPETIILSPAAIIVIPERVVKGDSSLRVSHNDFDVTGFNWVYNDREKSVSLRKDVRVVFHEEFQDLLK